MTPFGERLHIGLQKFVIPAKAGTQAYFCYKNNGLPFYEMIFFLNVPLVSCLRRNDN
jgi:hypothetical protein